MDRLNYRNSYLFITLHSSDPPVYVNEINQIKIIISQSIILIGPVSIHRSGDPIELVQLNKEFDVYINKY